MRYRKNIEILKAGEIFNKYKFSGGQFPVDVERIAHNNGIVVRHAELPDEISGVFDTSSGKKIILVNSKHSFARQRFSIAHELGHYFLHYSEKNNNQVHIDKVRYYRDNKSSLGTDEKEIEANIFASELLIPNEALRNVLSSGRYDIYDDEDIHKLAEIFGVSSAAITVKIDKLA